MNEKILLFDLDGTLIDSTQAILESFVKAGLHYGLDLENRQDEIQSMIGMTLADMFLKMGVSNEKIQECIQIYRGYYQDVFLEKTFLLPKVKESFQSLPKHYRMGVVTSKSRIFSEKILEKLEMKKYFFTIVGIEDVKKPKPDAEPIFKALEGISYQKNQVYMIGDTSYDMQSAKNAGVLGVGVSGKYQKDLHLYTSFLFEDMQQALNYIKTQE